MINELSTTEGVSPVPSDRESGQNAIPRVELFEHTARRGGKFLLRLNITGRPIANKYREGKLKRTLKRGFKERETTTRLKRVQPS